MPLSFTRDSRAAATPAVAGHQPLLLAVAVAACFSVPLASRAQPAGAQAIHGAAALAQQGNKLVVTTQNGAGTSHSAINWQSFSVPTGSVTQFNQPSAASTSINRVLGNNPSAILGTLTSNGKLVLVNPAGIAVGAGAIVDTAGFTASTLRMSDADALAGRMRFEGGGSALAVGGQILARNGDIVLIAPNVDTASSALIQSPNGATIIAAGQKVELTGRGLEGIKLEMQAPQDSAVNLGTLTGDAVGIFAGTLRHSGLISATAATSEGGKVVLKGGASLEIGGHVAAAKGSLGGQVHATASKVKLKSGAVIDVSGAHGGGVVLIGGGWQGADASIANAQQTIAETASTINADATQSGKGGTVVLWSDGYTNAAANITARGGVQGGAGGMVETSGKQTLVTSAAPMVHSRDGVSPHGQWLLDPESLTIVATLSSPPAQAPSPSTNNYESGGVASEVTSATLATALNSGANVVLYTSGALGTVSFNDSVLSAPTADAALQVYAHGGITLGANTIGIAAGPPPAGKLSILLQAGYDKGAGAPSAGGGVIISGGGSLVSNGGTITLAGQGSGGTYDVEVQGGISSGGGEVKFMADRLHVNAPVSAGSGTNARIHMLPSVNNLARSLALGTAADTSTALGSAELSFLTARVLVVGQGTDDGFGAL